MKKFIPYIIIGVLVVGLIGFIGYVKFKESPVQPQNTTTIGDNEPYFDQNAIVMYFYSPNCSHCQDEKSVLTDLSKQGYRVKPMNILDHPDYAKQYNIEGTPTFISQKDQARVVGFQKEDTLKLWLEQHK